MELGIYESLITETLKNRLKDLDSERFFIANDKKMDQEEAVYFLSLHLNTAIKNALKLIPVKEGLQKQIEVTNKLLSFLSEEIEGFDFKDDLVAAEGTILEGVLDRLNSHYTDSRIYLSQIMPVTRLTQSELFTGGNVGLSLESELKKEIRSADRVDLLVSFIKWKAIVILREAFQELTSKGGKLRVLTTTYMGATDGRAIEELSKLPNTEIKISYNNSNERLHAKAYLFYRNTGFHTGYIGSSNFSRSALTDGLEWNVKVTTKEIPHIIDKFKKTFESYWNSNEFDEYNSTKKELLHQTLQNSKFGVQPIGYSHFFDLKPYHYQLEILEKLHVERTIHGVYRNLVVAATGTGKTMVSAFDFKKFRLENPDATFLFIAHRIEILQQSLATFRNVLKDQNFGELMGDGYKPTTKKAVFATIQTFNNLDLTEFSSQTYYDYIVVDEVHHVQASTYQNVIDYYQPKILLGLTATPERMDGKDILVDFCDRVAAEIRLPDALNNKLLTPFQYFGVTDSIDYRKVKWNNGRYDISELTNILTANNLRVRDILNNLEKYTKDINSSVCLGFCASKEHAKYMADKFNQVGLKSAYLISDNSAQRVEILNQFRSRSFNYLFVVDMLNEGVDVPEIDTVLFLRPTESLTIFLQQLGRGLRLHEGKDILTVLDFVGNARDEYDFETKFRALIGKTNTTVLHEIERDFPHLPLGSSIYLEKKAKEFILENVRKATKLGKAQLINKVINFRNHTNLELTLPNFLKIYGLKLSDIYRNHTFTQLKSFAFRNEDLLEGGESYKSMLGKKWIVTDSNSYFLFIQELIEVNFEVARLRWSVSTKLFALMVYYDFYQKENQGEGLDEAIKQIGNNKAFVQELREFIACKLSHVSFKEIRYNNPDYEFPLQIHARYTREQILVALRLSTWEKQSSNREGVALNKTLNTEVLFVNLQKSEEEFSPTTMYDDYAISETLFHWQSQNATSPDSEKGRSYIDQSTNNKTILLFVREAKKDVSGFTQGYVFLGPVHYVSHEGSKPMSITWRLEVPLPNFLWTNSAKMMIG